jgi:hypothetical protein
VNLVGGPMLSRGCTVVNAWLTGASTDSVYTCVDRVTSDNTAGYDLQVVLSDLDSNLTLYTTQDLAAAGFPSRIATKRTVDLVPPELTAFSITPTVASLDTGVVHVRFEAGARDVGVGTDYVRITLAKPDSAPEPVPFPPSPVYTIDAVLASGSLTDGLYAALLRMDQFRGGGTFPVLSVQLVDGTGNSRTVTAAELEAAGYPTTLTLAKTDTVAPVVRALEMTVADTVRLGAADSIIVTGTLEDGLSGLGVLEVWLFSPDEENGPDYVDYWQKCRVEWDATTATLNAPFRCALSMPATPDLYYLDYMLVEDRSRNSHSVRESELAALGFRARFVLLPASGIAAGITSPVLRSPPPRPGAP